jgi:hypothetical protein
MRVLEINRREQGAPEAFIEPPAGVRAALPKIDEALQRRDQLVAKQHEYWVEAQRLRDGLHAAREHDRREAATAAEAGQPCPPSTAEASEAEAAKQSRLGVALVDKINEAQNDVARLITRERDMLARELAQRTAQHAAEHEAAIRLLEQARGRVEADVIAAAWLASHPAGAPQPNVMQIPQPPEFEDQPPRMWPHLLGDLRRDAAALPHRGPVTITDEQIQRHRVIVATHSDGKGFGGRITTILKGHTRGGAEAQDIIDRIHAETKPTDAA